MHHILFAELRSTENSIAKCAYRDDNNTSEIDTGNWSHWNNQRTTSFISNNFRLLQYLAVFRKHIPGDSTHELHQTMDGIEEVKHAPAIESNATNW